MPNTITDTITELADNKSDIQDALVAKGVTSAGKHGFNKFAEDIASITNQYTSSDEGKVVSSGSLVAQTSTTATANGTIDTTTNNEVVVNVPNTYTAADEGKVVSGGALVAQTAYPTTITDNDTYDTTENNSVTVNVAASGNIAYQLTGTNANGIYIIECDDYIYFFGSSIYTNGSAVSQFQYTIPNGFDTSKIGTLIGGALKSGNYDTKLSGSDSVTVSGNNLTLSFTRTSFPPNYDIWTLAKITKAVSP